MQIKYEVNGGEKTDHGYFESTSSSSTALYQLKSCQLPESHSKGLQLVNDLQDHSRSSELRLFDGSLLFFISAV